MNEYTKRHFIVKYESKDNIFKGERVIATHTLSDAQSKFFDWLKLQPVYPHMYSLSVEFKEVGSIV
jgi:hypothetical protein